MKFHCPLTINLLIYIYTDQKYEPFVKFQVLTSTVKLINCQVLRKQIQLFRHYPIQTILQLLFCGDQKGKKRGNRRFHRRVVLALPISPILELDPTPFR